MILPSDKARLNSGFTLIQLSIILTVTSLVFVATLPGVQTSLKGNAASVAKMNNILNTMRTYLAANSVLPCPADPTQAIGASNYGVAAANPGSTGDCIGGTPAAAYADATKNIAIGMVPVKTLGLSYADALDGYGRDITYAVDTNATGNSSGTACWGSTTLTGGITVTDNGVAYNTVAALVSHGADGYGAWLPLSGSSGAATRFDNGSTDTAQADNAQVAHGGGLTANGNGAFASFVRKAATSTFDDSVVYKSNLYTLNTLPASAQVASPTVTPPSNSTYTTGNVLSFTITYASNVTVTGTPRLDLSALGGGSIGTGNVAYATYQSGSGSAALTFSYTVQSTDTAPTSGLSMTSSIDLNGGAISGGTTCFTAPSLTGVLISQTYYLYASDPGNNRVLKISLTGTYVSGLSGSGNADNQFNSPQGYVIDGSNNQWVVDSGNYRILKFGPTGQWMMTIGGTTSQQCSGTYATATTCNILSGHSANACCPPNASTCSCSSGAATGQFSITGSQPQQIAFDSSGNLWVTDYGNKRVQEFNSSTGAYITSFPVPNYPAGIAIDNSGNLWITIPPNQSISKCTTGGSCTTYGSGVFGSGSTASNYVAVDSSGNIWAADQNNGKIQEFNSTTGAHIGSVNATKPEGFAIDNSGNFWYSNNTSNTIVEMTSSGSNIRTISTSNGSGFSSPQGLYVGAR